MSIPDKTRVEALEFLVKWKELMEYQTGEKIKVLRYDHVRKYKDSFLQFGQNNSIETHFTNRKDGVAKEKNRALLEKIRYLLSNTSLDKSFWVEAIEYASHLLNRLLKTVIGGKIPLEIWSGGAARDHGSLKAFGCPAYIDVKKDMLNSKVNKLVYSGYKEDLKGYKL